MSTNTEVAYASEEYQKQLNRHLRNLDPAVQSIIDFEAERQREKLILIASESLCPASIREAMSSEFTNLYAEGYPSVRTARSNEDELTDFADQLSDYRRNSNRRFYKGCEYADLIESLAMRRAAEIFANENASVDQIYVNVQPLSGAAANNAVYEAFVTPGDTVMGMDLAHGGHLTHGSPVNRSGKHFNIVSYGIHQDTGRISYEEIRDLAIEHKPRMVIAGYSAYPWHVDWREFRSIADEVGAILLADMSHYAGLIVGGVYPNPVGIADVTTLTTHKTLCGPRGAIILTTKASDAKKIDFAVFPGEQGGPHINNIAGRAVSFKIAGTPEFRNLAERIVANAKALVTAFESRGIEVAYGGTETHLLLCDLRSFNPEEKAPLRGEMASQVLDLCGITLNKNTIAGDKSAFEPNGVRIGTTWITQRGLNERDMDTLASVIHKVLTHTRRYTLSGEKGLLSYRVKVPFDIIEEAQQTVTTLINKAEPGRERQLFGYPHYQPSPHGPEEVSVDSELPSVAEVAADATALVGPKRESDSDEGFAVRPWLPGGGILDIAGAKAKGFLQCASTNNIAALKPGQSCPTNFLSATSSVLGTARVHFRGNNRYVVHVAPGQTDRVQRWLSLLSDGLVEFDTDDPARTLDGPVIIRKLASAAVTLIGKNADDVVQNLNAEISGLVLNTNDAFAMSGVPFIAAKSCAGDLGTRYDLLVPSSDAGKIWSRAAEAGAVAAAPATGAEELSICPDDAALVADTKPYFIGRTSTADGGHDRQAFTWEDEEGEPRKTCLYDVHAALTSANRLIPFGGWAMPVCYNATSIAEEHAAVRNSAGLFDVTHMGVLEFSGPNAGRFLDLVTTNEVSDLSIGRVHYSFLLDHNGRPIDDITIYRRGPDKFMMIVNAGNAEKAEAWLRGLNEGKWMIDADAPSLGLDASANIRNLKSPEAGDDQRVDLALQGPNSRDILEQLLESQDSKASLKSLKRFGFIETELCGTDAIVATTGYTGENIGYEIYAHPDKAVEIWNAIVEAGATPAGLGSRDSTRIEAGYPLYGHELAGPEDVSPVEAGYSFFVKLQKPFFIGRAAMVEHRSSRNREVVRFEIIADRARAVRAEDEVVDGEGAVIGAVTSCTRIEGKQIGLALVPRKMRKAGTEFNIRPKPRTKREEGRQVDAIAACVISRFLKKK